MVGSIFILIYEGLYILKIKKGSWSEEQLRV